MTEPKRIQRSRAKGSRLEPGAVCVSRGTRWGNPFKVGTVQDAMDLRYHNRPRTLMTPDAEHAARQYRDWVGGLIGIEQQPPTPEEIRAALNGKTLACWCAVDAHCHADVLLAIANDDA
ncbi:MAG: DUF4326 domain-containing protein [Rhodoglobus sp.]